MTAGPVKDWALYWYEKLQIEAWLRPITPHAHTVPKVCPGRGSDTDLDTLSARRKQRDRREAVFLFVSSRRRWGPFTTSSDSFRGVDLENGTTIIGI
jgi:hypothetical protein